MASLYITATPTSAPTACTGKATPITGNRFLRRGAVGSPTLDCKGSPFPHAAHLRDRCSNGGIGRWVAQGSPCALGERQASAGAALREAGFGTGTRQAGLGTGSNRGGFGRAGVALTLQGISQRRPWAVAALGLGLGPQRGKKEKGKEEAGGGKGKGEGGKEEEEGEGEEEDELGTSISDFTRFYENPASGEVDLQTAIVTYWKKAPWWDILRPEVQVDLVSVVHIGDQEYYEGLQEELYTYDKVLYEMVVDRSAREEEEQRRREEEEREREKREAASARQQYGDVRAFSRALSRAAAQPGSRAGLESLLADVREGAASAVADAQRSGAGAGAGVDGVGIGFSDLPAGTRLVPAVGVWERGSGTDTSAVTGNPWAPRAPEASPSETLPASPKNPRSRFFHKTRQAKGRLPLGPWAGQGGSEIFGADGLEEKEGERDERDERDEKGSGAASVNGEGRSRGRGSPQPRALLSGKRPLSPRKPRRVMRRRGSSVIGLIQRFMARAMRLSFQLDHIDYQSPNFLNADLDYDTFCNLQRERKESIFSLAREVSVKSTKAVMASVKERKESIFSLAREVSVKSTKAVMATVAAVTNSASGNGGGTEGGSSAERPTGPLQRTLLWASRSLPMPLVGLLLIDSVCRPPGAKAAIANQPAVKALLNLDVATALKVFLAQQLASDALDTAATVMKESVIVGERNKAAMLELHKALEGGSRRIAIFYGSAHLPDLDRRLKTELGLTPVAVQWRTAWSILRAPRRFRFRRPPSDGPNGQDSRAGPTPAGSDRGDSPPRGGATGLVSSVLSFGRNGDRVEGGGERLGSGVSGAGRGDSFFLPEEGRGGYGRSSLYSGERGVRGGAWGEGTVTGGGGIATWVQRKVQWPLSRYQTVALLLLSLVLAIDLWLWEQLIEGVESWAVQVIMFTVKILDQGWSL